VRELLSDTDDRFVIMGRGEEIVFKVDASALAPPPPGIARTYLLETDGFCKDMDLYTACPDRIEPLPFHAMSSYPYPESESYPRTPEHERYLSEWNTRIVQGQ